MKQLELLSGAKNALIGIEAVKHGADAVYIGADKFGARAAAGNPLDDIKTLVDYAHLFHARVYVTVNTILKDSELAEARDLICRLYEIGTDAVLVQDMAVLEMDIPPIALHASTQCDNCTPEKVKFLEDAGFSQVVLARECGIETIREIRKRTNVKLEAFVHGALCVSYSGRCYASYALSGRSANRGECSQICRLPFDMQDAYGHSYGTRHWLSLKDLNLSARIGEMAEAGISSFKIEGRLKEADYVKNTTAYYNNILNAFIAEHPGFCRASDGETRLKFTPDLSRSFNRGFCEYFYNGRNGGISSHLTPKSIGKEIGRAGEIISDKVFSVNGSESINKQDGLCYFDKNGGFHGVKVNRCENKVVHAASPAVALYQDCRIFRNSDADFLKTLSKESAERKIKLKIYFDGKTLECSDGKCNASLPANIEYQKASIDQKDKLAAQLSKLGDSIYEAAEVNIADNTGFVPFSIIGPLRREMIAKMDEARRQNMQREFRKKPKDGIRFTAPELDYTANVSNRLAGKFYKERGVSRIDPAFEISGDKSDTLMWCKHCLRFAVGKCPKHDNPSPIAKNRGELGDPAFLISKNDILRLSFDCQNCQMKISGY